MNYISRTLFSLTGFLVFNLALVYARMMRGPIPSAREVQKNISSEEKSSVEMQTSGKKDKEEIYFASCGGFY